MSAKKGMSAEDLKKAMVAKRDLEALHRHLEYVEQDIRRAEAALHELQQKKQAALERIEEAEVALGDADELDEVIQLVLEMTGGSTSKKELLGGRKNLTNEMKKQELNKYFRTCKGKSVPLADIKEHFEKHVIGRPIANITNYFKGVITEEMKDPETSTRNRAVLVKEIK